MEKIENGSGAALSKKARKKRRHGTVNKRQPADLTVPGWDFGAEGQANRSGLQRERVADVDGTGTIKRARRVDMLEVWHRRGLLSASAFNAAEKLRNAFEATQKIPGLDYQRPVVDASPKPDHAVTVMIDRVSKYHEIARHIASEDLPLVARMVLDGGGPEALGYRGPERVKEAITKLDVVLSRIASAI